jgi:hypothetical protein
VTGPEIVSWRDAHFSFDDDNDSEDFILETVGWVRPDGKFLRIESEHQPEGGARAVTRIPIENIIRRQQLYTADEFAEWQAPDV